MNRMTLPAPPTYTAPECPGWCATHNDDYDHIAEPGQQFSRAHLGPVTTMTYAVPGSDGRLTVTVTVRPERFDVGANLGPVAVAVFGTEDAHRDDPEFASIGINDCTPMGAEDAAKFAALLATVAAEVSR